MAAQKGALAVGRDLLLEQLTLDDDRAAVGKKTAQERMNVRDQLMLQMTAFIDQLSAVADQTDGLLEALHKEKAALRQRTLQKAIDLCTLRESALEDVVFLDANEEATTVTEQQRDEAEATVTEQQEVTAKLQKQLAAFQTSYQQAADEASALAAQQQQLQASAQFYSVTHNNAVAVTIGASNQYQSTTISEPRKQTQAERYGYGDKYSSKNVKARKNADGSVLPASAPKLMADGSFSRPSGRQRKGCEWDSSQGVWVPAPVH